MNCQDTERIWNELLDGRRTELTAEVAEHATTCPDCSRVSRGYELLRTAVGHRRSVPASQEFLDQLRFAVVSQRPSRPRYRAYLTVAATAAAAAVLLMLTTSGTRTPKVERIAPPHNDLGQALAGAGTAGLDFIEEVGAPAARFGRAILSSRSVSTESAAAPTLPDAGSIAGTLRKDFASLFEPYSSSAAKAADLFSKPRTTIPARPEGI